MRCTSLGSTTNHIGVLADGNLTAIHQTGRTAAFDVAIATAAERRSPPFPTV
ncbi:hypothetical protein H4W29_000549 [Rhizobium viscosum]|uniref:Uncharacterized protein n=1 Tax=Rhizobium viscosum TaxID=1673 RepID=A0ABR9IJL2_RHIVS|nr:hypothetical protein [Rhizobium viscosum]